MAAIHFQFGRPQLREEQFTMFQGLRSHAASTRLRPSTSPAIPRSRPRILDGSPTGGDDIASFLLGVPDGASVVSLHGVDDPSKHVRRLRARRYPGQCQAHDAIRGFATKFFMPVTEGKNQLGTFRFPHQNNSVTIVPKGTTQQLTPAIAAYLPLQATASKGLISPDYQDVAPRVGLAYKLTNKLVLRSGYGIFYGGVENGPFSFPSPGFNPPFFITQSFNSPCGNPVPAAANPALGNENCAIGLKLVASQPPDTSLMINNFWTQGYPASIPSVDPNNPLLYSIDSDLRTPMMQQWHLGMQYQLPADTVVEIYVAWEPA